MSVCRGTASVVIHRITTERSSVSRFERRAKTEFPAPSFAGARETLTPNVGIGKLGETRLSRRCFTHRAKL